MKIIGHRGARGLAPENTLAGIRKALEYPVDGIEIDVRVTKDDVVVLGHDRSITVSTKKELSIRDHTHRELLVHTHDLATLEDAILLIDRRVTLAIEVKPGGAASPIIKLVKKFIHQGWTADDLALITFDYTIAKQLRESLPELTLVINDWWSTVRVTARARQLQTRDIGIASWFVWSGLIRFLTWRGYQFYAVTNDVTKARRWERAGIYAIATDYPDRFFTPIKQAGAVTL